MLISGRLVWDCEPNYAGSTLSGPDAGIRPANVESTKPAVKMIEWKAIFPDQFNQLSRKRIRDQDV